MINTQEMDKVRSELESLISHYGYEANKDEILNIVWYDYILSISTDISNRAVELIGLIKFIRKSNKKRVELRNNAECIEVPNLIASDIEKYLNILLNDFIFSRYEHIGISYRETEDTPIGYVEPFSDEELETILKTEKGEHVLRNKYRPRDKYKVESKIEQFKNPHHGEILTRWRGAFIDLGLIATESDADGRRIHRHSRPLYQFFYDCMAVIGKFEPVSDIDSDIKYYKVRACLKSYNVRE